MESVNSLPQENPFHVRTIGQTEASLTEGPTQHRKAGLEQGTDLRYIQALLGHESSKTTERYTQVTRKGFENLVSPLDRLAWSVDTNKKI